MSDIPVVWLACFCVHACNCIQRNQVMSGDFTWRWSFLGYSRTFISLSKTFRSTISAHVTANATPAAPLSVKRRRSFSPIVPMATWARFTTVFISYHILTLTIGFTVEPSVSKRKLKTRQVSCSRQKNWFWCSKNWGVFFWACYNQMINEIWNLHT